jgi:uncharacterized repeat protein (TIGR01451 family)
MILLSNQTTAQETILSEITVCPAGPPDCQYSSIQAAVDAATDGTVVKVAAGHYTGVHARPAPPVYPWPAPGGTITQVVYISNTLTLRGGYAAPGFAEPPDPEAHPTTVDAEDQGRALFIGGSGSISVTVEGLRITGAGVNDEIWESAKGGGITVVGATATIRNNRLYDNVGVQGGGLYLWGSSAIIIDSTINGNMGLDGAGLAVESSQATVRGNVISANHAPSYGGGIWVRDGSEADLRDNIITSNQACDGGGVQLSGGHTVLINNVIADNELRSECMQGSGLSIWGASAQLLHTTIARNTGGQGSGVWVHCVQTNPWTKDCSTLALTNTVLVSHSVGISVTGGNTVTVDSVLWHDTPITVSQSVTAAVAAQNQHSGDPAFALDGYHLTATSAAIDRGVDAGVADDIDGDARPAGARPDLGADETEAVADLGLVKSDGPDPAVVGQPLTYTLVVVNNGPATAVGVVVTETLPANATFDSASPGCALTGDYVVCSVGDLAAGEGATAHVHLIPNAVGQLIDLAAVGSDQSDPYAGNDADSEFTTVGEVPVTGPILNSISPRDGTNDGPTAVTITGQNFEAGAMAALAETPLQGVTFVHAGQLEATVPGAMPAGTYDLTVINPDNSSDLLPDAFTVLAPAPPSVDSVAPAQGPIDTPVTLDIRGANFASDISATLALNGEQVPLVAPVRIDSSRLLAVVPVSVTPEIYSLVVTNPDTLPGSLPNAYEALPPEANDDLYAEGTDLWLEPPTIHEGETLTIGLTLRRQGGWQDLADVVVRFSVGGGVSAFTATAPLLSPRSQVSVTAEWAPGPSEGEHVLYATIDPLDTVEENNEANNVISRSVTVLPLQPDLLPPTVERVTLNDGALQADNQQISLDVAASDNPGGSGVESLLIVEYVYDQSGNDWHPVQRSDWLPYETASTDYGWRLVWDYGIHIFQIWAADEAGNISSRPGVQMINFVHPWWALIQYREVDVYRYPLASGERLQIHLTTAQCSPQCRPVLLYLWSPSGERLLYLPVGGDSEEGFTFMAPEDGTYQIEVEGDYPSSWSGYKLSLVPLDGQGRYTPRLQAGRQEGRLSPIVIPGDMPDRRYGLPSPPLALYRIYLPIQLRDSAP